MYFLPAFLDHYRHIGIEQFIFLDDQSDDGTNDYLLEQRDIVILKMDYRYGHPITNLANTPWKTTQRAGELAKTAIPKKFLPGKYAY